MEQVTIKLLPNGETLPVSVESFSVDRSLALHRPLNYSHGDGWTITHIRSGLALFVGIRRKADAERAMESLVSDLGAMIRRTVGHDGKPTPSAIRLRDAVKSLAQTLPLNYVPHYWR